MENDEWRMENGEWKMVNGEWGMSEKNIFGMRNDMNQRNQIDLFKQITLILIAIVPVLYLNRVEQVPLKAFILGTGSWGIGTILKMIAHQLVVVRMNARKSPAIFISLMNGFISGLFELSASLGVILLIQHKFAFDYKAIISFGLAIGSFESIIVATHSSDNLLKGTALEESTVKISRSLEKIQGMKQVTYCYLLPVLERILATFIHISTRGLIFVSLFRKTPFPMIIALLVFIIADGVLGYYYNVSGKLLSDKGFTQVYGALFILTFLVTMIFFLLITPYQNAVL